ncbi:MAG: MFS transporter [Alphaproteobacteria bacterium]|nr:MFS transporter [Alphaproteobacteria bacterium]
MTSSGSALRSRGFVAYLVNQLCATFASSIVTVAVGWQIYAMTGDPLDLGLANLVEFLPALALVLVTGSVADRFDRRFVVFICVAGEAALILGLLTLTAADVPSVWPIFLVLAGFGVCRAFWAPAERALLPNLVPPEALGRAIALSSSTWQMSSIVGPALGGLLYGIAPEAAYGVAAAMLIGSALAVIAIPRQPARPAMAATNWTSLLAGFRFIWGEKVVFGSISLDLVAVFLGGAVALLPVYASDILDVGPVGLGLLRASPGIGAVVTALALARYPINRGAGVIMLLCVATFGLATAIFGLSVTPWLSIAALATAGAADMISVYIRGTLIQLRTPDALRGRVNAVDMTFIGASNELGGFRAGVAAAWLGAVAAVTIGGIGSMAAAGLWAALFPDLRKVRRLVD